MSAIKFLQWAACTVHYISQNITPHTWFESLSDFLSTQGAGQLLSSLMWKETYWSQQAGGLGALMHLHPTILPMYILFVPLNYTYTITDPYNSPDTRWLSLSSFFCTDLIPPLFPPPPSASLSSGFPGVLSLTVAFVRPVWCWHGWCILACNDVFFQIDSKWPIVHGNTEETPSTVSWSFMLLSAELLPLGNKLTILDQIIYVIGSEHHVTLH